MTDVTSSSFRFPAVQRKKVTAAFDGGRITSDGGVLLLAQAEREMDICRQLATCIADRRDPSRVVHKLDDILRARVLAIACGYEDADDLDALLARARALQARVASLYLVCQASGAPWAKHQVQWRWNEACRRAGVVDAHLHDVRARAGTDKDAQEGPKAAQGFLGHRSPRTTEIYLRDKRTTTVRPLARKKA